MVKHIVLDSSPLGQITNPASKSNATFDWVTDCKAAGHVIYLPEIVDYEIRRELVRANKLSGLANLNTLKATLHFVSVDSAALLLAAGLWAAARKGGYATGHPERLDIDVILAAQALLLPTPPGSLIVATGNVRHLSRFVPADEWQNIMP